MVRARTCVTCRLTPTNVLWGTLTAIPITLMSLASCATYSQFVTLDNNVVPSFLAAANFFCTGMTVISTSLLSYCAYTLSAGDMTNNLFLKKVLDDISASGLEPDVEQATLWFGLHLGSTILGLLFLLLGKLHAAHALSYLPYTVTAGFLACVGAIIVKGAWELMTPEPGQSWLTACIGVLLACISFLLKRYGIPTNLSSVLSIILSLTIFYSWVFAADKTMDDLRSEGWLFPGGVATMHPMQVWKWDWHRVSWAHALPNLSTLPLAFVACLNRALTIAGIESAAGDVPYSTDDEMSSTSLSVVVTGFIGGVAMNPAASMTALCKEGTMNNAVTARCTAVIVAALHFAVWGSGLPLTNFLPRFLLGGLLMMMGVSMLVDWVWGVRRRVQWTGVLVIGSMLVLCLARDLITAVGLGVVVAVFRLNLQMAQVDVLKYHVSGAHFRSGEIYNADQRSVLRECGDRTEVLGLTGFIYEGVAISLSRYIKEVVRTHVELETLILDFFACHGINDSACAHIAKVVGLCESQKVRIRAVHVSPSDKQLLTQWCPQNEWFQIDLSVSEVLNDTEHDLMDEMKKSVKPIQRPSPDGSAERLALDTWIGPVATEELLAYTSFVTLPAGEVLSTQGKVPDRFFVAVPGFSDVRVEVQTGTANAPARLLRTTHGAICAAEAIVGTISRGTWRTMTDSVGIFLESSVTCKVLASSLPSLLAVAYTQQCQATDQLSARFTMSRGGGWAGVTFDQMTNERCIAASKSSMPRPFGQWFKSKGTGSRKLEEIPREHTVGAMWQLVASPQPKNVPHEKFAHADNDDDKNDFMVLNYLSTNDGGFFLDTNNRVSNRPTASSLFQSTETAPIQTATISFGSPPPVAEACEDFVMAEIDEEGGGTRLWNSPPRGPLSNGGMADWGSDLTLPLVENTRRVEGHGDEQPLNAQRRNWQNKMLASPVMRALLTGDGNPRDALGLGSPSSTPLRKGSESPTNYAKFRSPPSRSAM